MMFEYLRERRLKTREALMNQALQLVEQTAAPAGTPSRQDRIIKLPEPSPFRNGHTEPKYESATYCQGQAEEQCFPISNC